MSDSPTSLDHLVHPVEEHLLPLLDEALLACSERHRIAEGEGADNFSFGTDAWSLPARKFKDAIEDEAIPFSLAPVQGCVLAYGDDRIRHHRVGWSEVDDIEASFPGNAKAISNEVERGRQLRLEFPGFEPPSAGAIVLAYMSNPSVGLCAAYLARVGRVENGKVVEWAETRELYRRDGLSNLADAQPIVPPEKTAEPVVRRIPKKEQDEEQR